MSNKYTGATPLMLNGKKYTLVFDWRALAKLRSQFNDKDISNLLNEGQIGDIAAIVAIGLEKHHDHMTAETVIEISPPLMTTLESLDDALTFAYFGPDGVNEKKPRRKILMWLLKLLIPKTR